MNATQLLFLRTVVPAAQAAQRLTGIPAAATIAQAILESSNKEGWGKSSLAVEYNNYFGIKATHLDHPQTYVELPTTEYFNGKKQPVLADFERYATPADCFAAHARLLYTAPRYKSAMAYKTSVSMFCWQLQICGYSTSPIYEKTLMQLVTEYNLAQYDAEAAPVPFDMKTAPQPTMPRVEGPLNVPGAGVATAEAGTDPRPIKFSASDARLLREKTSGPQLPATESQRSLMFTNVFNHPKTSATGLLIGLVTVAGVFAQQGVTLGHIGTGNGVTLVAAVATALLGLLARDPSDPAAAAAAPAGPVSGSAKLGVLMLCVLLLTVPFAAGCSGTSVAQDIVNWTPALQSAVATVDTTASLLAPTDAPIFTAATVGFDAASNLLVTQAKAYLANPSASTLAQIQAQVVVFQQQVNASLLQVAKITDLASQTHVITAIQAVGTVVSAMLALVTSISSKAAVAQMVKDSPIKLASVREYVNQEQLYRALEARYGYSHYIAAQMAARAQVQLEGAGF